LTDFGQRLRSMRLEAGLSQGDLAGGELSASYVSLLETGKRSPSGDVLNQLASRLGCSTTQLTEGRPSERDQRIELEIAYARLAIEHGESDDARTRLERLLAEDGLPVVTRDEICLLLAKACERSGDHDAAVHAALPLYERACRGEAHVPVAVVAMLLCRCYLDSGDLNRAAQLGEQALQACQLRGLVGTTEYFRLAATVMSAYTGLGDFVHARAWADGLLAEAESTGVRGGQAALYWNAAIIAEHEGRMDESLHLCQRAMGHLSELDNTRDYARLRVAVADILLACDPPRVEQAHDILSRAIDDLRDLGGRADLAEWSYLKSAVLLHQGDAPAAEGRARTALDLLDGKATAERCHALLALGDALAAQNRHQEAGESRALAYAELGQTSGGRAWALLWRELAERMSDLGDHDAATQAYRRSLDCAGVRDRSRAVRAAVHQLAGRDQPADAH